MAKILICVSKIIQPGSCVLMREGRTVWVGNLHEISMGDWTEVVMSPADYQDFHQENAPIDPETLH